MDSLEDRVAAARAAAARRDWAKALGLWDEIAEQFPLDSSGLLGRAETLMQMGQLDASEATFAEAKRRFPANVWAAAGYAAIAARRRDWPEALLRYEGVLKDFPKDAAGLIGKGE